MWLWIFGTTLDHLISRFQLLTCSVLVHSRKMYMPTFKNDPSILRARVCVLCGAPLKSRNKCHRPQNETKQKEGSGPSIILVKTMLDVRPRSALIVLDGSRELGRGEKGFAFSFFKSQGDYKSASMSAVLRARTWHARRQTTGETSAHRAPRDTGARFSDSRMTPFVGREPGTRSLELTGCFSSLHPVTPHCPA